MDRVQPGRELVIAEKSGSWIRVYANTDIQESRQRDAPLIGSPEDAAPPPISGWMEARNVVEETTPNGDQVVMGEAANQEALASDPRGPARAAQTARLFYRRLVEIFPEFAVGRGSRVEGGRYPVADPESRRVVAPVRA